LPFEKILNEIIDFGRLWWDLLKIKARVKLKDLRAF
jgi:hypothetical protein